MDSIFHERQEGSLCAQHCLNSLLQGPYFSAVDLADIGRELDEAERATMAEGDINSPEYLRFIQQPSSNMDDSGYFSVQVIVRALKVWGLELVPFGSAEAIDANMHPEHERSFICNFKDHWLTIRKLGRQWFNLNSLLTGPELISDTYLAMFLVQLQKEGYSIFVVRGSLPDNEADQLLNFVSAVRTVRPVTPVTPSPSQRVGSPAAGKQVVTLQDLHNALQGSLAGEGSRCTVQEASNPELVGAAKLGMNSKDNVGNVDRDKSSRPETEQQQHQQVPRDPALTKTEQPAADVGTHLTRLPQPSEQAHSQHTVVEGVATEGTPIHETRDNEWMTEERMLEMAIKMSLADNTQYGTGS